MKTIIKKSSFELDLSTFLEWPLFFNRHGNITFLLMAFYLSLGLKYLIDVCLPSTNISLTYYSLARQWECQETTLKPIEEFTVPLG